LQWRLDRKAIKDHWLDKPVVWDHAVSSVMWLAAMFVLGVLGVLTAAHESQFANFFSALVSAIASLLGFVIATLAIIIGFVPRIVGAFNKETLTRLLDVFHRTINWMSVCFVLSLIGMLVQSVFMFALVSYVCLVMTHCLVRSVFVLSDITNKVVDAVVDETTEEEREQQDAAATFELPLVQKNTSLDE
jgi:hypothetical protein